MSKPKQLMHAKTSRRQNRYFGDLSPQDIAQHDRRLAGLRRADAVNDVSLEVTARRLATVFPQEIDAEPYVAVVKAFLDKPANTIHKNRTRSKMQERHQKALRLLHAITLGGERRVDYCTAQGIDLADANRMLEHLCSKDQELRCAVDFISAHGTGTSSQNRQPEVPACYSINVGGDGLPALAPAVRLAIKTTHGAKVLVFPNLRSIEFTGTSCDFRQATDPAGYITNGGAATFTAHVGDATWTLLCRDEPQKDWRGIEGVFEPGNETVTVNKDNNDRVGVHSLTRDGKWIEEIADTGDPGLQRPGDRWVRVGPRAVIEARKGGDKLQANTTTPPTFRANPCSCTTCTGTTPLTWRVACADKWKAGKYDPWFKLVETPQLAARGHDCQSIHVRRDVRWRQRGRKQWLHRALPFPHLPWQPGRFVRTRNMHCVAMVDAYLSVGSLLLDTSDTFLMRPQQCRLPASVNLKK